MEARTIFAIIFWVSLVLLIISVIIQSNSDTNDTKSSSDSKDQDTDSTERQINSMEAKESRIINSDEKKVVSPQSNIDYRVKYFDFEDEEYFINIKRETGSLIKLVQDLLNNKCLFVRADSLIQDRAYSAEQKMYILLINDMFNCMKHLGYDLKVLNAKYSMPVVYLYEMLFQKAGTFETFVIFSRWMKHHEDDANNCYWLYTTFSHNRAMSHFYLEDVLRSEKCISQRNLYFSILYKLFTFIIKSDNIVTIEESNWLKMLSSKLGADSSDDSIQISANEELPVTETSADEKKENFEVNKELLKDSFSRLDSLVSLDSVKKSAYAIVEKIQEAGKSNEPLSLDLALAGTDGSGKRTFFDIYSNILSALNCSNGKRVIIMSDEITSNNYDKTQKVLNTIKSNIGGVIYIELSDLINSLNQFAKKSIFEQIAKAHQEGTTFVLGGTPELIASFICDNNLLNELKFQFLEFRDANSKYQREELLQIFIYIAKKSDYEVTEGAASFVLQHIDELSNMDKAVNGRYLNVLFEKVIKCQTNRLASLGNTSPEDLSTITDVDVATALGIPAEMINSYSSKNNSGEDSPECDDITVFDIEDEERQEPSKANTINIKVSMDELGSIISGEKTWDAVQLTDKNFKKFIRVNGDEPFFDSEIYKKETNYGILTYGSPCPFVPKDNWYFIYYYTGVLKDNMGVLVEIDDFSFFPIMDKDRNPQRFSLEDGQIIANPEGELCEWNMTFGFHIKQ